MEIDSEGNGETASVTSGRLERIELENFKSYGGKVLVGPFKGFNAVIGTNGSGKSNLMDAISFVLGVRTTQLRGNQLRDLVYRDLSDSSDDPSNRKAIVKLFYRKPKEGRREGGLIEFSRTVTLSGSSEYRVNGRQMSLERYNRELAKIGILVKARNFLVFQNEVESIASKSPKELTALFEEVSGSAEFKDEYEEAVAEKEAAEDEVTVHWQKRKTMAAEKRQFKQQKEEAEKYQRLKGEVAKIKTQQVMFQLYHLDNEIKSCKREAGDAQKEYEEKQRALEEKLTVLTQTKDAVGKLDKQRQTQERKLKRIQDEIDKFRPQEVKLKTELNGAKRRLKGDERSLEKARENADTRSTAVDTLTEELRQVDNEIVEMKRKIAETEQSSVSAASMAEYRSLKETAATRTSALTQDASAAERNRNNASRLKDATVRRLDELNARRQRSLNDANTFKSRAEDLANQIRDSKKELERLNIEKRQLTDAGGDRDKVRAELERTIQQTTQALRDAKADMHESSREKNFNQALEKMQRLFPGVKGRLSDLCRPTQPKYREAIAVVFGKQMNAIVVDNNRTGADCIAYMKDTRGGVATFLPLDNIRPRPVDEALRRLGGTAKLVIDVVSHHESIAKAVQYAAANAVVCDTLDEARRIRYDDGRKIKICSLDGTLINKAGFMTGGTSRSARDRAAQWDRSEIEALKKKRSEAQEELNAMGAAMADRRQIAILAEKIDALARRISILELDQQDAESRANNAQIDSQTCENELSVLEQQVQNAEEGLRKANAEFETVQSRLHGLENELFGDFAQRHGISTVQEFELNFIKRAETLRENLIELEAKQSKVSSRLKYETTGTTGNLVARLEVKIKQHEEAIANAESNLENLDAKRAELVSRAEGLSDQITKTSEEREDKYAALRELRQEYRRGKDANTELRAGMSDQFSSLEHLRSKRATILSDARVAQIHVPTRRGGARNNQSSEEEDDDVEMVEENDEMEIDAGNDETQDPSAAMNLAAINYSTLPSTLKGAANANADVRDGKINEMSERIASIIAQLDQMAPNMRAKDHMAEVAAKLSAADQEAEKARERAAEATSNYYEIEGKRNKAFTDCFEHVQGKIEQVYKQLTISPTYTMGGSAHLSLEKQHQPYLGGIKYNVMPPSKRLRDMDQLSGGERTVAALALLFAIHDYRPSPFFVLDEIDAALDNLNVGRVSNYIRNRSSDLQTIVISLKDKFFEKADALIGVYRDVDLRSSRMLSLDLNEYPEYPENDENVPVAA